MNKVMCQLIILCHQHFNTLRCPYSIMRIRNPIMLEIPRIVKLGYLMIPRLANLPKSWFSKINKNLLMWINHQKTTLKKSMEGKEWLISQNLEQPSLCSSKCVQDVHSAAWHWVYLLLKCSFLTHSMKKDLFMTTHRWNWPVLINICYPEISSTLIKLLKIGDKALLLN